MFNILGYLTAEQKKLEKSLEAHGYAEKPLEEDSECQEYLKTLKLDFKDGKSPNYEDPDVQCFYLLRYGFGYPYIYKCMYEKVLDTEREI